MDERCQKPATSVKPRSNARKHRRRQMHPIHDSHSKTTQSPARPNRCQAIQKRMGERRPSGAVTTAFAEHASNAGLEQHRCAQTSNHDPAGSSKAAAQRKSDDQPWLMNHIETAGLQHEHLLAQAHREAQQHNGNRHHAAHKRDYATASGSIQATRVPANGTAVHTLRCTETGSASERRGCHVGQRGRGNDDRHNRYGRSTVWER